jgi:hypothetical protein
MTQQRVGIQTVAGILAVRKRAQPTCDPEACQALSSDVNLCELDETLIQA